MNRIKRIICFLFFHKLVVLRVFSPVNRKLECTRCKRIYGMNDEVKAFVEWDGNFDLLESMHDHCDTMPFGGQSGG